MLNFIATPPFTNYMTFFIVYFLLKSVRRPVTSVMGGERPSFCAALNQAIKTNPVFCFKILHFFAGKFFSPIPTACRYTPLQCRPRMIYRTPWYRKTAPGIRRSGSLYRRYALQTVSRLLLNSASLSPKVFTCFSNHSTRESVFCSVRFFRFLATVFPSSLQVRSTCASIKLLSCLRNWRIRCVWNSGSFSGTFPNARSPIHQASTSWS